MAFAISPGGDAVYTLSAGGQIGRVYVVSGGMVVDRTLHLDSSVDWHGRRSWGSRAAEGTPAAEWLRHQADATH